eukprot:8858756-Alexandrium_andersonii.AAC.1
MAAAMWMSLSSCLLCSTMRSIWTSKEQPWRCRGWWTAPAFGGALWSAEAATAKHKSRRGAKAPMAEERPAS